MRDINEVAEKMARNGFKIAKSLGCAFRFESEFMSQISIGSLLANCNKVSKIGLK